MHLHVVVVEKKDRFIYPDDEEGPSPSPPLLPATAAAFEVACRRKMSGLLVCPPPPPLCTIWIKKYNYLYRVSHLLVHLVWVDCWFGCSTILPSCSAASAKFPSAQAECGRQWNSQTLSQPNPDTRGDGSPCVKSRTNSPILGDIYWRQIN